MIILTKMDRNGDNFLLNCQNAHTIGQSKRGTADEVVCFIANLSTTSADSVAIIIDLIFIERLSPNNCSVVDISTNLSGNPANRG